ncbi:hypothetical protein HPB50_013801 [Hyalomma asiaticum]|uniref:Uncharacterized protein n=1 Tax=Hyalomma asiaticum TaxID=266040 RepID=A0ACB7SQT5_HYAAI|nr:hypothetical protein HPB50_013801 [Hyalomma asiaticum]
MARLSGKTATNVRRVPKPMQLIDNRPTEDLWLALRGAFGEILETRSTDQRFDELYQNAYLMVARNEGERLYHGLRQAVTEHLTNKVRAFVLARLHEDDFLRTLNQAWRDHQASMRLINDIVKYMEIAYVSKNNVDSVRKVGVSLFRDEVAWYDDVREHLRETMLGLVKAEREGQTVDRVSLKEACEMLAALGMDSRTVYEEDFEKPFLADTAQFYALLGQNYVVTMEALQFVARMEQHIKEESERAKQCLDESTVVPVVQVVEQELIGKHMRTIVNMEHSGVEHMLQNWMTEDLTHVFRVLKCVQGGAKTFLECVSKHLRNIGRSIVNDHGDSVSLIPKVMELRDHFDYFIRDCFDDDRLAKQMITTDFEYILSLNRKSPEHLSAFVDNAMRKGISDMTKQEIYQLFDKVLVILRFLQDKDLFERYYKHHLAKRLLLNRSTSIDAERTMIAKLRKECGVLYTSKMEAMLKDVYISNNMVQEFKTAVASCRMNLDGVDLNVRVLTTGFWPLAAATQPSNIAAAPWNAFLTFRRFYLAKHNGRQLTLQPHLGWADMSAIFYGPVDNEASTSRAATTSSSETQPRTYTIEVSTYQMCVLMLFNHYVQISFEDIASETNIPETSLVRALNSLCASNASEPLITKTPATNEIDNDHVFSINESFTSGLQKVKIQSTSTKKRSEPMRNEPVINLDEDRRYELEAAIVRIMKARKQLSHDDLLVEVTKLLQGRYTPSAAAFKRRVDALVEREYLERSYEDPEVYIYTP